MNISIHIRHIFYFVFGVFLLIFLFMVRAILIPFIIAMIFAYIFNPLISYFNEKFRVPRSLSIIFVYVILIVSVVMSAFFLTRTVVGESISISATFSDFFHSLQSGSRLLPFWIQPFVKDYSDYLAHNQFNVVSVSPFPLFTRALSGILALFVTFFAAFFFLKDNEKMINKTIQIIPSEYRKDLRILLSNINTVLSRYLRGQMLLIASMIVMLLIAFSVLGIRYALTISVISALFEIVPFMGPIFAGILGIFIILISGGSQAFNLNPYQTAIIVAGIYYISRQIQDYLILPYIMSRATHLHPLVILFSVLAGQQLYGVIGVLLAVPVAASLKITYEFVMEKVKMEDVREGLSVKGKE